MKRLVSIALMALALIALASPSLIVRAGAHAIAPSAHGVVATARGALPVWSCKNLGGKRVLPCQFDQAVLTRSEPALAPRPRAGLDTAQALLPFGQVLETELPPPRSS
jgi:hypothetical protein